MSDSNYSQFGILTAAVVVSVAVAGYFTGLQSPMNHFPATERSLPGSVPSSTLSSEAVNIVDVDSESQVIPATHYSQMAAVSRARLDRQRTSLAALRPSQLQTLEDTTLPSTDKKLALAHRSRNRAFNGAPPTVLHPIDQMSTQTCMACHGEGLKSATLRASKMSHQFLSECTQCHVENNPRHREPVLFRKSTFVGLPAPIEGPRSFPGAPPQIPHSTWMRVDCLSCHGPSGDNGIRTSHPWRQECQQCHVLKSTLDQIKINDAPAFLKLLKVMN